MKQLKIGVVGWHGRSGHVSQTAYQATGGLIETVACVEPYDEAYALGCKANGFTPRRYLSVTEMAAKESLDGIIIGSPNHCHLENLRELKGRNIPLLLEKPLDSTFEKICDVVRFARSYSAPILVGHCMRYAPILQKARELLSAGAIGKICSVRFVQNCHYGNGGYHNWRRTKETSGTWLIEKATHDFDIMMWLIEALPSSVAAVQKLQAYGGDKPDDLRCRDCADRLTCPESVQNTLDRYGENVVQELKNAGDLCVFSRAVDTPDNEHCLIDFQNGVFGTYVQWFFSPRSYHHRIYELHGDRGAMEIDLGAEFGGKITTCPRFGTLRDREEYVFDYLMRNHYNADGPMTRHFYQVMQGTALPDTTVEQAFMAELLGYAAIRSADEKTFMHPRQMLPEDLSELYNEKVY